MRIVAFLKGLCGRVRCWPALTIYSKSPQKRLVDEDVKRWLEINDREIKNADLRRTLIEKKQFRNLFYFRLKCHSNFIKSLLPLDPSITIADDGNEIEGGGLYFMHATASHVACARMGYGCTFRQLSTLGVKADKKHKEKPIIGKYVDFGANVTAIGAITIGDYAVIGAGAVVVKDVPAGAIVAGNPAKIVGMRKDIPAEKLAAADKEIADIRDKYLESLK